MIDRRVLITGGAGFLGSHLCDRFLAEGWEVLCLDNLLTGRRLNVEHLREHSRFTFLEADVTRPTTIDGPIDLILHFASPASPKDYAEHPIHTLKVGSLGTYHALGLAKARHATFVLASSSEIYGDPQVSPQTETYWGHVNPVGPRSVYDEAKRFAEAIAAAYHRHGGVDVRIARIFNTYGPRMRLDDGRALPTFVAQALQGLPLTVYGNGTQTRSFCYVSDLIDGLYRLAVHPPRAPDPLILNLGNPDEVTILQLARDVIDATRSTSTIVFRALPLDDPKVRRPSIEGARQVLGWTPTVSRQEGLRRTIAYFREQLAAAAP